MKFKDCRVLISIKLDNDDTQDFDLRREQALSVTSDPPLDKVLEGLYVSKLQDSSQAQTITALHNQEILRGGGKRDYHRLRMCVIMHIEQAQRSKKFRIQPSLRATTSATSAGQRGGAHQASLNQLRSTV